MIVACGTSCLRRPLAAAAVVGELPQTPENDLRNARAVRWRRTS